MEIKKSLRQYQIGKWFFAVDGPEFEETELFSKFRVTSERTDYLLCVRTVTDFPTPKEPPVSQDHYRSVYRSNGQETQVLRFEKDLQPFVLAQEAVEESAAPFVTQVLIKEAYLSYYHRALILGLLRIPERVLRHGAAFLHASFVERNGEAILFTAKKQTGKSTQAGLWEKYRHTRTVNGDRALLFEEDGQWFAASTPYCGTSKIAENRILPVKTVVILHRAEELGSARPVIKRASVNEALKALLTGLSFHADDEKDVNTVLDISDRLIPKVPFLKLYGTMDEESVRALEEQL